MATKEEKKLTAMAQALTTGVMKKVDLAKKLGVYSGRVTKLIRGEFKICPGQPVNDRIVRTLKQLYNEHFPGIKPTGAPPETGSAIAKKNVPTKLPSEEKAALQPQAPEKPVTVLSEATARNVIQEKMSELSIDLLTLPLKSQQKAIEAISILMLGFRARRAGLR